MQDRLKKISKIRDDMNKVDDELFKDFCKKSKIPNIRVYEERELAGQQERLKERMHFEELKTQLNTRLEFEKSRDTQRKSSFWE
jgi:structural maintenance of chromosome 1